MPMSAPSTAVPRLVCVAGPDQGKQCQPSATPVTIGRDASCGILSDDPDVAPRHGRIYLLDGEVYFRTDSGPGFLDGHAVTTTRILRGAQLRIGRSLWQVFDGTESARNFGAEAWQQFNSSVGSLTGVGPLKGFSLKAMFADTFKRRTPEETEAYFTAGTPSTTPSLEQIDSSWPRPWMFFRVATLALLLYVALYFLLREFNGDLISLIPALLFLGSFAIPCSILVLYYELNAPRNVSAYEIVRLFLIGSVVSAAIACFLYSKFQPAPGSYFGALGVGIIEESTKASCLLLVVRRPKYRWTLNGLLFGATIGTGFAIFESIGFALQFYVTGKQGEMLQALQKIAHVAGSATPPHFASTLLLGEVQLRAALYLCAGHAQWTALTGAALWRVRGDRPFSMKMLTDPRFLRVLALAIGLHMLWDSPLPSFHYVKYIAIGLIGWMATLGFVQDGLNQIRSEKLAPASVANGTPPAGSRPSAGA